MDVNDIVLDEQRACEIAARVQEHLIHWQGLAQYYESLGVKRWRLRPKHHDLEELGKFVRRTRINPRFTSCFNDESLLGQLKHVATKCHASQVLLRLFQRLILMMSQRWQEVRAQQLAQLS